MITKEEKFALLMTILSQIREQDVSEQFIFQYLQDFGFKNVRNDWENYCKLPYFNLTKKGKNREISISSEGIVYYDHFITLLNQLSPPISLDSPVIDSILRELRHRKEKVFSTNDVESNLLRKAIIDVAGAILNEYIQIQGTMDWRIIKVYMNLLEDNEDHPNRLNRCFELLELLYSTIKEKINTITLL